jgi:hypothetical protein
MGFVRYPRSVRRALVRRLHTAPARRTAVIAATHRRRSAAMDEDTNEATAESPAVDEGAALIAAELMPVAVFLGWTWEEVRPDREIVPAAA